MGSIHCAEGEYTMSTKIMLEVARHSTAKGNAKLVLLLLASYAHPDGTHAEMSLSTIAREAGLSRRQVNTIVHFLAETGHVLLESAAGAHGTNRYAVQRPWMSQGNHFPSATISPGAITAPLGQPLPTIDKENKDLEKQSCEAIALGQPLPQKVGQPLPQKGEGLTSPTLTPAAARWLAINGKAGGIASQACGIQTETPSEPVRTAPESTPTRLPRKPRGEGLYTLGKLCKRGHDHEGTGQSLRRLPSGSCLQCDLERQEAKRQAQVQATRAARPPRRIIDLSAHRQRA